MHDDFTIYRDYLYLYFIFKIRNYKYHKHIKYAEFRHKVFLSFASS